MINKVKIKLRTSKFISMALWSISNAINSILPMHKKEPRTLATKYTQDAYSIQAWQLINLKSEYYIRLFFV